MIQEFYNILLYLFEMAPSGSLWDLSLTNQLMALIQRYFFISNSTLTFMMITLLPIIMVTGTRILTYIGENLDKLLYVQIDVTENELIFTPINEYITKHFDGIAQLKKAKGITGYIKPLYTSQHASGLRISGGATGGLDAIPLVALIPLQSQAFEIFYKGYKIIVTRSETTHSNQSRPIVPIVPIVPQLGSTPRQPLKTITLKTRSQSILQLQSIIQEWVNEYYNLRENKLVIFKCRGMRDEGYWSEYSHKQKRSFSSVVLKKGKKERIYKDIITFKDSKKWYSDRGIPFKRGYLLHGPPGTGKTSFIQSLGSKLNMNIAIVNLSTIYNDDMLSDVLSRVPRNSIIVIEDIDGFDFKQEKDASKNDGNKAFGRHRGLITGPGILNAIDVISSVEESIIFMTCNNINNLPPALIRPGRVDIISHLSYADDYQIELLFWKFFCPDVQDIPLEDIPKESLPVFANVATDILYSIRTSIMEYSKHEKMQIEISPAEITNFFLKHAIKFNLPNNPELVDECLQSLQDGVPDLVEGIVRSRKQARKHENDSSGSEERNEDLDDESSEEEL